jgi:hypothetical protein
MKAASDGGLRRCCREVLYRRWHGFEQGCPGQVRNPQLNREDTSAIGLRQVFCEPLMERAPLRPSGISSMLIRISTIVATLRWSAAIGSVASQRIAASFGFGLVICEMTSVSSKYN